MRKYQCPRCTFNTQNPQEMKSHVSGFHPAFLASKKMAYQRSRPVKTFSASTTRSADDVFMDSFMTELLVPNVMGTDTGRVSSSEQVTSASPNSRTDDPSAAAAPASIDFGTDSSGTGGGDGW